MDHMIGITLLHHELTRKSREKRKREWSLDAPLDAPLDAAPRRGILERLLAWRGVKRKETDRGLKRSPAPHFR